MKIEDIKNKILQLAIQGKLVEQRKEEEPASVLLERIREEKEKIIKEKKIKKEKPLPEITEEEKMFEIPEGWEWCRLGDIISISSGKNLTKQEMSNDGTIPVYGGNGITGYHNICNVEKRTIVIGRVGFYCGSVHLSEEMAWITDNAFITDFNENYIDREFLVLLLKESNLRGEESSTAQPVISGKKIYPIVVVLPPLEEQKRIVAKVDELFAIVDELNENKESLKKCIADTRNKVLQLAIQGKLVSQNSQDEPASVLLEKIREEKEELIKEKKIKREKPLPEISEEEKMFEIPEGWEWCRFDAIGTTNIGLTYKPSDISNIGIPVLRSSNIQNGKMDYSDLVCVDVDVPKSKICNINDLLICARNGSKRLVGKCALIDREGMSFGAFMAIFRSDYNKYVNIFLNTDVFRSQLSNSNTVTINQITQNMLKNMICPLPPLEEQKRIVAKVDEIMKYVSQIENILVS